VAPVAAAYTSPDTLSVPPTVMMMPVVAAVVAPAVVDQFDLRLAAIVRDIGRRGFQIIQNAARVGHAGNGIDRPNNRRNHGGAGKTQNAGKECSSIHRNLQSKSAPRESSSRQWLNGS
jgi:hypothetical protein